MSARAKLQRVHGREHAEAIGDEGGGAVSMATQPMQASPTPSPARAGDAREPDCAARCSPDPFVYTDRYRLVTPFALRL
jgi:hypothetical protein